MHTPRGWERVRAMWVEELLAAFADWVRRGEPGLVRPRMEHINRDIKLDLIDRIVRENRAELCPVLEAWQPREVRKMRASIQHALAALAHPKTGTAPTRSNPPAPC
ncbi:MAG: hypothetical protein ABIR80_16525 [Opitutaceae bacterium]